MSLLGTFLCLLYSLICLTCLSLSLMAGDEKSRIVLMQLPVALQLRGLQTLGLAGHLYGTSWLAGYAQLALPTLGLLYTLGALWSRGCRAMARLADRLHR